MTGDLYLDLLISLGGVAVLVAVSFALGGWRSVRLDEAAIRERLAFDEPDFRIGDILPSSDGRSAAAIAADGTEIALVFAVGDGVATRRARAGAWRAGAAGKIVSVSLHDPSKWVLKLAAPSPEDAALWASRLQGQAYS